MRSNKTESIYNKVQKTIQVRQLDLKKELPDTDVDVLMANLHHTLLADLFNLPSFWKAKLYILFGFMPHEEEQFLAALPDSPPPFLEHRALDKWRAWVMGEAKPLS
jgi:hypothetical protein